MGADDLLVVAGEASGDLHGARLLAELRALVPGVRPFGLGGAEMVADGFEALADSAEISVVGIAEVLRILPRARRIFRRLLAEVDRREARAAVLIDFPDFNLRLARELRARGLRVIYYISPQVWAWRRGRVRAIAETVDRMLVLFRFEAEFYERHGVCAVHVGHPLVDEVPEGREQAWDRPEAAGEPKVLALLPGSRPSEVRALLPTLAEAAERLAGRLPLRVRLIQAPSVPSELFDDLLVGVEVPVERVREDRFAAIAESHLAFCASGTATLEVGLLGTPMIVAYRLKPSTYLLARLLVELPHFSMVNLVLGEGVVPELLQRQARPERLAEEAAALLEDPAAVAEMRRGLGELRARLGDRGASGRAAREVARCLGAAVGEGAAG